VIYVPKPKISKLMKIQDNMSESEGSLKQNKVEMYSSWWEINSSLIDTSPWSQISTSLQM